MNSDNQRWKVCVKCFTYNQASYITDTLKGFTMQQTDFPFVCIVVDDASTDGEQTVIENYVKEHFDLSDSAAAYQKETDYARITFARHKTNKNCYFAVLYLKENHYSKRKSKLPYLAEWQDGAEYIAFCEGDDYWIAPFKLQKQVDFLDAHPDYGMSYTKVKQFIQAKNKYGKDRGSDKTSFDDLLRGNDIPTLTVTVKRKLLESYYEEIKPEKQGWLMGDYPLWLYVAANARIYFLQEITATYRVLTESASHSKNVNKALNFFLNYHQIKYFFLKRYKSKTQIVEFDLERICFKVILRYRHRKRLKYLTSECLHHLYLSHYSQLKTVAYKLFIYNDSGWIIYKIIDILQGKQR